MRQEAPGHAPRGVRVAVASSACPCSLSQKVAIAHSESPSPSPPPLIPAHHPRTSPPHPAHTHITMADKVDAPTGSDSGSLAKESGTGPKAIIKNVDMSEEMQQEAVDVASAALEKYNIEKDIAAQIKKEFDKRHGPTWHVVVGKNFGSYVTHGASLYLALFNTGARRDVCGLC